MNKDTYNDNISIVHLISIIEVFTGQIQENVQIKYFENQPNF